MESYKLTSHGLPQPPCGWCENDSTMNQGKWQEVRRCNREAGRKLLHLTWSVTFSHMETLKLHRLRVVDHCGQVRMDIRGSTYVFIRCHPCLLIFYSDQALWTQEYAGLSWCLQGDSQILREALESICIYRNSNAKDLAALLKIKMDRST